MKIYKVFVSGRNERWQQKPDDEKAALQSKLQDIYRQVDGKMGLMCSTGFTNEKVRAFGMEEFPSVSAIDVYATELERIGWTDNFEAFTLVGAPFEGFEQAEWHIGDPKDTEVVYKLFITRGTDLYFTAAESEREQNLKNINTVMAQVGGKRLMVCETLTSEEWMFFGLEQFPDMDAAMKYQMLLRKARPKRYTHSLIYFGKPMPAFSNIDVKGVPAL